MCVRVEMQLMDGNEWKMERRREEERIREQLSEEKENRCGWNGDSVRKKSGNFLACERITLCS